MPKTEMDVINFSSLPSNDDDDHLSNISLESGGFHRDFKPPSTPLSYSYFISHPTAFTTKLLQNMLNSPALIPMLMYVFIAFTHATWSTSLPLLLSTPPSSSANVSGGLGLSASASSLSLSFLALCKLFTQLVIFERLVEKWGVVRVYSLSMTILTAACFFIGAVSQWGTMNGALDGGLGSVCLWVFLFIGLLMLGFVEANAYLR